MNRFENAIAARMISTYVEELRRMEEAAKAAAEHPSARLLAYLDDKPVAAAPVSVIEAPAEKAAAPEGTLISYRWINPAARRDRAVKWVKIHEIEHGLLVEVMPVGEKISMILPLAEIGAPIEYAKVLIGQFLGTWIDGHHNAASIHEMICNSDFVSRTFLRAFIERATDRKLSAARIRRVAIQALHDISAALVAYKIEQEIPEEEEVLPAIPANAIRIEERSAGHSDALALIGFMLLPLVLIAPLVLKIAGI